MEYIIKCSSYRILKEKLNELLSDIDKDNIFYFDLLNDNISDICEECNYNSIFNDKKAVIVYNSYIFGTKFEYKDELSILEKYLSNPNCNTILIFLVDNLSKTKKCVKMIEKRNGIIDIKKLTDTELKDDIKLYLKEEGFKIQNKALDTIIKYQNSNYDYILNELDKIITVKKDYVIENSDIEKYSTDNREDDIFKFIDVIVKKDISNISYYLNRYIKDKKEPAYLLSLLAGQYRFLYSVKSMNSKGYRESDIARILDSHPYRVKLSIEESRNYTIDELKDKILSIGKLDEEIKLGIIDKYVGLKLLLYTL